jgi:hypothetical protein
MESFSMPMTSLISSFAALLTLLVAAPTALHGQHPVAAGPARDARERLLLARDRLARHERALESGDPSRSPYYRFHTVSGQNGSRHAERSWHDELLQQG